MVDVAPSRMQVARPAVSGTSLFLPGYPTLSRSSIGSLLSYPSCPEPISALDGKMLSGDYDNDAAKRTLIVGGCQNACLYEIFT